MVCIAEDLLWILAPEKFVTISDICWDQDSNRVMYPSEPSPYAP